MEVVRLKCGGCSWVFLQEQIEAVRHLVVQKLRLANCSQMKSGNHIVQQRPRFGLEVLNCIIGDLVCNLELGQNVVDQVRMMLAVVLVNK